MLRSRAALVVVALLLPGSLGAAVQGGASQDDNSQPGSHEAAAGLVVVPGTEESLGELVDVVLGLSASLTGLAAGEGQPVVEDVRPRAQWLWPLAGEPRVVKFFDPPDQPWLPGHRGVDLAGLTTERVLAVADGTVTYSGSIAGIGIVSITHADGLRSTYQPVTDRVDRGETLRAGDPIGLLGDFGSHCLIRSCLHLGAVRGKRDYLDPLLFLQPWELSLLPHTGE